MSALFETISAMTRAAATCRESPLARLRFTAPQSKDQSRRATVLVTPLISAQGTQPRSNITNHKEKES